MNYKKYLIYAVLFFSAIFLLFFLSNTQSDCPRICHPCNNEDKICIKPTTGLCSKNLFCEPGDKNCICV